MVKSKFNLLKVMIAVCIVSLTLSLASAFLIKSKTVSAYNDRPTPVDTTSKLEMVAGASVRLEDHNGLRYRVMIDANTWTGTIKPNANITLGVLIFPTKYIQDDSDIIGNYHLAIANQQAGGSAYGTFEAQDIEVDKGKVYISMIGNDQYYCANGVLSNVKDVHRGLEYTAVGYTYNTSTGKYAYADGSLSRSLQYVLSCLYFWNVPAERTEYRSIINSIYSANTWLGQSASLPYIIDTSTSLAYYNTVISDVKAGETFSGKYFKITTDRIENAGTELLGNNGSYTFAGTFTSDSAVVKARVSTSSVVNSFNYAQAYAAAPCGVGEDDQAGTTTWYSSYDGHSGVVKVDVGSSTKAGDQYNYEYWPWFSFIPENIVSTYSTYTQIKITMKIESASRFRYLVMGNNSYVRSCCLNEYPNNADGKRFVNEGVWEDYYFDITAFNTYWSATQGGSGFGVARVWSNSLAKDTSGVIYIDEITAIKGSDCKKRPNLETDEIVEFREQDVSAISLSPMTDNNKITYSVNNLDLPSGATHGAALIYATDRTDLSSWQRVGLTTGDYRSAIGMYVNLSQIQGAQRNPANFYDDYWLEIKLKFNNDTASSNISVMTNVTLSNAVTELNNQSTGTYITIKAAIRCFITPETYEYFRTGTTAMLAASGTFSSMAIYSIKAVPATTSGTNPEHTTGTLIDATKSYNTSKLWCQKTDASATYASSLHTGGSSGSGETYMKSGTYIYSQISAGVRTFQLRMIPTCSYDEFAQKDYIQFTIWLYNNNNSYTGAKIKWFDNEVATFEKGIQTVKVPISRLWSTRDATQEINSTFDIYNLLFIKGFTIDASSATPFSTDKYTTFAIDAITIGVESSTKGTATTVSGSTWDFVKVPASGGSAADFYTTSAGASVVATSGTWDGHTFITFQNSGNVSGPWHGLKVKPGVKYNVLRNYSKLNISLKIDYANGTPAPSGSYMQLYMQGVYSNNPGTNSQNWYYSWAYGSRVSEPDATSPLGYYNVPYGAWVTLTMPIDYVKAAFYNICEGNEPLFITRGRNYYKIYVERIWLS